MGESSPIQAVIGALSSPGLVEAFWNELLAAYQVLSDKGFTGRPAGAVDGALLLKTAGYYQRWRDLEFLVHGKGSVRRQTEDSLRHRLRCWDAWAHLRDRAMPSTLPYSNNNNILPEAYKAVRWRAFHCFTVRRPWKRR